MKRRDFLKFSGCGLAAVAVGGAGGWNLFAPGSVAHAASGHFGLTMVEADAEMVDGICVPMWAYSSTLHAADGQTPLGARIPGPVLFAQEGEKIRLHLRNQIGNGGPHGFAIPGVVDSGAIPFNAQEGIELEFTAPTAGTYLYFDPFNAPVNRVMGLHGALVVLPGPVGNNTPYSDPTVNAQRLFNDLGVASHFPGHPWDPDRNAVWVFNVVDPDKCAEAFDRPGGLAAAQFLDGYTPQYFTLNGKSGFFAAQHGHGPSKHDHAPSPDAQSEISIRGNVGQPVLIRTLNAGLMWHSPHIHGNHVYRLAENGTVLDNLEMVDTWMLPPLARKDLLLPFIAPPDIPANFWERAAAGVNDELFPLIYPMHDHNEISNTAAGGNYPQGIATHWQIDGDADPLDEVLRIDRAELRVRTGQLIVEGHSSGAAGNRLALHAGRDDSADMIGTTTVQADGSWSFRGRGLKALTGRRVSVHNHATGAERRNIPVRLR